VDEAGRNAEPPVIVAPPGLEIDPDVKAADEVVENEGMSSSRKEDAKASADPAHDAGNGSGPRTELTNRVPFPADDIGKPKGSGDGDGRSGDTAAGGNGVLDSGRQAVRNAVTATNSLFTSRSAKRDPTDKEGAPAAPATGKPSTPTVPGPIMAPPVNSGGTSPPSMFSPGERKPSFSPSASSSSRPGPNPPSSPTQAGSGGNQSLWREVRPPSPTPPPAGMRPPAGASGPPSGLGFSAGNAASAVGGAAAGLAGSVASALQGRRDTGGKRRRQAGVRRSPKRQAQLTLARVEPWSVMKFSFVASVVAFIILFVAVAVLYMVLSALGVFTSLQHTVDTITSSQNSAGTNISGWFSASRILGYTGMFGALNIVLITAMSTIGAVIYNLIATTIGGVEVTLRETD
jgi:Transmembrane domain of unknown function (DUF3566)